MQKLSQGISQLKNDAGQYSVSVYSGELTTQCVIDQVKKIKAAFSSLPAEFYDLLSQRIRDLKFSDERLIDAVNNVIDTCIYPQPTIANILHWDSRIKLYTYYQVIEMVNQFGAGVWENYKRVIINGNEKFFASVEDISKHNLTTKPYGK